MSSPLITISSRSSPSEAADMTLQHNVRHFHNFLNNKVKLTDIGLYILESIKGKDK